MIKVITEQGDVAELVLDFTDEGVELIGTTHVKGDAAQAEAYAPFFEADLRRNFAHLWPVAEAEEGDIEHEVH